MGIKQFDPAVIPDFIIYFRENRKSRPYFFFKRNQITAINCKTNSI